MPVGHIGKFDIEECELRNFGVKCYFSKIRIGHVMLKFLAIRNFRHLNNTRVELSYLGTENKEHRNSVGPE